ncbi:chemotaxis protein [Rhizobium sp. Leaf311]|uniref:methyl-accepting chemotaxis protein n=1 Tax=Rhizobium sp. Leaf311 TaxID=1736332 RepID=UPI000716254C|nr:HAMP domain-containing methyl-accepting chemotaxis protein [Rhizobium sp. Leaf311]KQQ58573.1 chemotaxis protein [Rhizobium sp. Leaf311]
MSFLKNATIKAKVVTVIASMSVASIAGLGYVSWQYKHTDNDYSYFIDHNAYSAVLNARTSGNINGLAMQTLRMSMVDPASEAFADAVKVSKNNFKQMDERQSQIAKLVPEGAEDTQVILKGASELETMINTVISQAQAGQREQAQQSALAVLAKVGEVSPKITAVTEKLIKTINDRSSELSGNTDSTIMSGLIGILLMSALLVALGLYISTHGITAPIARLRARMASLAAGDTGAAIDGIERKDEVGQMAAAVQVFRENAIERSRLERETEANRSLTEQERIEREEQKAKESAAVQFAVDSLASALSKLAEGDTTYRLRQPFAQTLDGIRNDFNTTAEQLQSTLTRVAQNARGIDSGANEIRAAADDLAKRTEQQAASVEETAAALEQITTTVKDATRRAQEAGHLVSRAKLGAEQSGEVVRKAVTAMNEIEKSSGEISNIIGVIDEIAFQTNLLALNAGVEAARAGEAGKGFAVVAQEVRELAQRSANAAKDIKSLITTSNTQVEQGVQLVGETGTALETIVTEVQEINRHVAAIAESAQEQSSALQQINTAVNQMDQDTQKNAAMVEESTAASHGLASEVQSLNQLLAQFKLSDSGYAAASNTPRAVSHNERPSASPARALGRKISAAFSGNAALDVSKTNWEEF